MVNQPAYNPNDRDQLKAGRLPQPRGHRHPRARLVDQAVRRGRGARLGQVHRSQRDRHLARLLQGRHQDHRGQAQPRRDQPLDDPREELERRHGARRAGARARADLRHAQPPRIRPGDHQRLSRRVRRPAGALFALAPDRHRDARLRLWAVGDAAAARARLRNHRLQRRLAADLVPAGRPAGARRARVRGSRRAPAGAHARVGRDARGHRHARLDPGLQGRRQDRHGLEVERRRLLDRPLPRGVRRRRAGDQSAPRRGGHGR